MYVLLEKSSLKITSVLSSSRRKIQARCKDSVKGTLKFLRKGNTFSTDQKRVFSRVRTMGWWGEKEREPFPASHSDGGVPTPSLPRESWGHMCSKTVGLGS
jgi:hypothetical protein